MVSGWSGFLGGEKKEKEKTTQFPRGPAGQRSGRAEIMDTTDSQNTTADPGEASWASKPAEWAGGVGKVDEALTDSPITAEERAFQPPVSPACSTSGSGQASLGRPTYYEFFAGAGMVRLGLGPHWTCLLANDNDVDKATSYAANFRPAWPQDRRRCPSGAGGSAWPRRSRLGVAALSGREPRRRSRWPRGAALRHILAFWNLMMALRTEGRAPRLIVIENVTGLLTVP